MLQGVIAKAPGISAVLLIAIPAWLIGQSVPVIGGPILGILFGMLFAFWNRPAVLNEGVQYTSKKVLQYAIILLGFEMNLFSVLRVGQQTLLLMVFTLTATFVCALVVGKLLRTDANTTTLVGVGTAICGGSAIAATAPVIRANDEEVAHAISTISLFNVIAAFLFPFLGHLLGMSDQTFGLWAGTAINDTSSVGAAGYSFSNAAGDLAVVVKLTRTLMIIPITIVLALVVSGRSTGESEQATYSIIKIFPWFVLGFAAASVVNTFAPMPVGFGGTLAQVGKFMIVMAMVAIGLNAHLVKLAKSGIRPILLGLACWIALALTSLGVQYALLPG